MAEARGPRRCAGDDYARHSAISPDTPPVLKVRSVLWSGPPLFHAWHAAQLASAGASDELKLLVRPAEGVLVLLEDAHVPLDELGVVLVDELL